MTPNANRSKPIAIGPSRALSISAESEQTIHIHLIDSLGLWNILGQ